MSRRFRRLEHGLDPAPFLAELAARPDLWSLSAQRQSAVAVQRETEAVLVFDHGTDETFRQARERHPITYVGRPTPAAEALPRTTAFVRDLARRVHGVPGRAALVRLRPRGHVYEHVDQGLYYHLRGRYHLVLKSVAGSPLRAGPETVRMREGELWWFDNRLPHEAVNESDEERIHLIVDVLSPGSVLALPIRILRSPADSLRRLGRKLVRRRRRDVAPGQDAE
jgi:hypothetical protein